MDSIYWMRGKSSSVQLEKQTFQIYLVFAVAQLFKFCESTSTWWGKEVNTCFGSFHRELAHVLLWHTITFCKLQKTVSSRELPTGQSMACLFPAHLQTAPWKTCLLFKRQLSWLGEKHKGDQLFWSLSLPPCISLSPSSSPLTSATPSSQIFWLILIFMFYLLVPKNDLSQWVQTKPTHIGVVYFTHLRLCFYFLKH